MGVLGRITYGRLAIIGAALAAVFMMGHLAQAPALADDAARMSVSVSGCSGDECNFDTGETFTLSVSVDEAPDAGYVLVQSFIDYGPDLTYNMTDAPSDEVLWPDASPDVVVRDSIAPGTVLHGALTGVIPPLPVSDYEGIAFELEFQCSDSFSTTILQLLPSGDAVAGTSGALLSTGDDVQITPKVDSVTVICGVGPTPVPTATPEPPTDGGLPSSDGGLPSSGSGALSAGQGGSSATLWLVIGVLALIGAAGLGTFGWREARGR